MDTVAVIVAAGRGARMGEALGPKQYVDLAGRMILARTIERFLVHASIDGVLVVIHADDADRYGQAISQLPGDLAQQKLLAPVVGGPTRQRSVCNGLSNLAALSHPPQSVLIHDAARPFVTETDIDAVVAALVGGANAAIAASPVVDTLKRVKAPRKGAKKGARKEASSDDTAVAIETVSRDNLWRAFTPQGFAFQAIHRAHQAAARDGTELTDDAAVAERVGLAVRLVPTNPENIKITHIEDLAVAERMLMADHAGPETDLPMGVPDVRTGTGFDVHRFADGDGVWLCGVLVPHSHRLDGHSDADVGLHALTDALLGAIGDGDIGSHFPPTDPQWKGAASDQFLAHAVERVRARGGVVTNVDVTLLCEAPKIGPHRDAMRTRIGEILALSIDRVAVKATTTERLGFTGRREGIAAMASATVVLGVESGA
ncbi:MAG: bifunctional 2-C-methyl-D-erythritol 4-phosphate cytidylyltransferase/2-C-methyl-D-erythritol 2,4-cyclodiphosphate synthase [Pseudomonadota bacterium]